MSSCSSAVGTSSCSSVFSGDSVLVLVVVLVLERVSSAGSMLTDDLNSRQECTRRIGDDQPANTLPSRTRTTTSTRTIMRRG